MVTDTDVFASKAEALTTQLVSSSPGLMDPVSEGFAAESDDGYGEWTEPDDVVEDDIVDDEDVVDEPLMDSHDDTPPPASGVNADLMSELDDVMSRRRSPGLLTADRRSEFVHTGEEEIREDSPPWYMPWKWINLDKKSHRVYVAVGVIVPLAIVWHFVPVGGNKSSDSGAATTSTAPPFEMPTITQAPTTTAPAGAPKGATDGPVGIKSADSRCTAGSTDPKPIINKTNPADGLAWMCVPGYGVPGTVLRIEFDGWYVITGLSAVPGWMRSNPDRSDEWLKHRTVQKLTYKFNDPDETALEQETNNTHGEVPTPVNPPILASAMTITINETAAPTPAIANTTHAPGGGGTLGSDKPVSGDLKDFAMSSISIIGYRPVPVGSR
ncbi:F5/8 type C domain-containing protein [Mycobacteroides abscessus subsp. massiliense]|nr:F5/8 type C domain-containing protein [Mycobacteroides abscessus subsp. massiliense]